MKIEIKKILLLLISVIIFIAVCEILSRVFLAPQNYGIYESFREEYSTGNDSLLYIQTGVCIYNEDVNVHTTRCDSYGTHYEKYEITKLEKTFRIVTIGDSFTDTTSVQPSETYSYHLEEILNSKSDDFNFQVYNFGIAGYNTEQELVMLREKAIEYNPDLVILQFHDNDISPQNSHLFGKIFGEDSETFNFVAADSKTSFIIYDNDITPLIMPLPQSMNIFLVKNSHFFRFVSKALYATFGHVEFSEDRHDRDDGIDRSFDAIREMKKLTEENNIDFFMIEIPGAYSSDNCMVEADLHNKLRNFTNESKIPYVDFCDHQGSNNSYLRNEKESPPYFHYNPEGYRLVAEVIYENLLKYDLLPV